MDGRKERKKLAVDEGEAAVVRLIVQLACVGLTGQPMGTRAIAKHLNDNGYTLRGRKFHNSNVDGILTREHYSGRYRDRTRDDRGVVPSFADEIIVDCPKIIEPDVMARVAAIRAKAAPRVTAPRITNSPVLLGGLATCGHAGCNSGMVIRGGKGGQYRYYVCNNKATAGADICGSKSIREDALDSIVPLALKVYLKKPGSPYVATLRDGTAGEALGMGCFTGQTSKLGLVAKLIGPKATRPEIKSYLDLLDLDGMTTAAEIDTPLLNPAVPAPPAPAPRAPVRRKAK